MLDSMTTPALRLEPLLRRFDMYSDRWPHRLAVFALIAAGGALLATGRMQGGLLFAVLVWANRDRFFDSIVQRLHRQPWLLLVPALAVIAFRVASPLPAAHDDLLRQIASAFWTDGYRGMYAYTALPPFEHYPSFDGLLAVLAPRVGPLATMWLVQALAWGAFVTVFVLAASRVLPDGDDRTYWVLGALLLVVSSVATRLTLGRPEVFMSIWALAAVLPRSRAGSFAWAASGIVLGSTYWLAPIYFPAVLLLPLGARTRLVLFAAMGALWVGMWQVVTGTSPIEALHWLGQTLGSRLVEVGENASAVNLLALPGFVVITGAAVRAAFQPGRDLRLLALAAYFLAADQVRYVSIVAPLLALFALGTVRSTRLPWTSAGRFGAVAASVLLAPAAVGSIPRLHELPAFELPAGSLVLTGFTAATYAIPFYNPGRVRVSPGFEIGAAEPWLQSLTGEMQAGDLDCKALAGRAFTHVVENTLKAPAPPCLRLIAVNGSWRLWKVSE